MKKNNPFRNMMFGFRRIIDKIQAMDYKEVDFWRNGIIVAILINIFGIYWFLGLKSLSVVLLLFLIGCLGVLLHNSREIVEKEEKRDKRYDSKKHRKKGGKRKRKMEQEKVQQEEKGEEYLDLGKVDEAKKEDEEDDSPFGLGLPSSEEYNKRMEDQFGSFGF